jgi:hypothetical protein
MKFKPSLIGSKISNQSTHLAVEKVSKGGERNPPTALK